MTLPLVLICDDDSARAERWQRQILTIPGVAEALDVRCLPTAEFAAALTGLGSRREAAREPAEAVPGATDDAGVLDRADMLIVDYDLTIGSDDARGQQEDESVKAALRGQSGEQFAYLARCYSFAGFIVLVNQEYKRRTFDLTMQRFVHSYADLNIQQADITSPELWMGTGGGYRPSHWPLLLTAPALHTSRVVAADPDSAVLATVGITGGDVEGLAARQLDPLVQGEAEPASVTFADLVQGVDGGLDPKDEQPDARIRRAISAAAVARWLETMVLPAQNVVSDAAHLAQRFPSLVGEEAQEWEPLGAGRAVPAGLAAEPPLAPAWTTRPVWSVAATRDAVRAAAGPLPPPASRAFCEDTTRFVDYRDAVEYESDLPGSYDQRFVARLDDVTYHPFSRLLKAR